MGSCFILIKIKLYKNISAYTQPSLYPLPCTMIFSSILAHNPSNMHGFVMTYGMFNMTQKQWYIIASFTRSEKKEPPPLYRTQGKVNFLCKFSKAPVKVALPYGSSFEILQGGWGTRDTLREAEFQLFTQWRLLNWPFLNSQP